MPGRLQRIWGWILALLLPELFVVWLFISLIGYFFETIAPQTIDLIHSIESFLNRGFGVVAIIAIPALIVGIILLVVGYNKRSDAIIAMKMK